jgi:hypothetical protein
MNFSTNPKRDIKKISKIEEKYQFSGLNVDNAKIALITGFVIVVVLSVVLFIFR